MATSHHFMGLIDRQASLWLRWKRTLAGRLSSVKSWGVVTQGSGSPNSQKDVNNCRKRSSDFYWNLAAKAPNSGVGEESVGCHPRPAHLQTTGITSASSPRSPHHHSGIWLLGSDYPSTGFYSLYFFWKCVGVSSPLSPSIILSLSLFPCFCFAEVSGKRRKPQSYVYFISLLIIT